MEVPVLCKAMIEDVTNFEIKCFFAVTFALMHQQEYQLG